MARHAPTRTAELTLDIETREAGEVVRQLVTKLYWQRDDDGHSQILLRVEDPPSLRHTAVLALERTGDDPDLYVYVPELRSVRRMTGRAMSGSLFGTDLIYEDAIHLYAMSRDAVVEHLPGEIIDGRAVHVLRMMPKQSAGSSYSWITSWIDAETCFLRQARFYDAAGRVIKEMTMPTPDTHRGETVLMPRLIMVRDSTSSVETRIRTSYERYDEGLADHLFSSSALGRGR